MWGPQAESQAERASNFPSAFGVLSFQSPHSPLPDSPSANPRRLSPSLCSSVLSQDRPPPPQWPILTYDPSLPQCTQPRPPCPPGSPSLDLLLLRCSPTLVRLPSILHVNKAIKRNESRCSLRCGTPCQHPQNLPQSPGGGHARCERAIPLAFLTCLRGGCPGPPLENVPLVRCRGTGAGAHV